MVIELRFVQPEKEKSPISITDLGMVIEVILEQYWKAELPMLVTPFSITTFLILLR
jgi:hypothetical protein